MSTLLYQQSNIEVFWNEPERWLYVKWIGFQTPADLERDCEQLLRLFSAKNAESVLNDNSAVEGTWIGASEWTAKDWFPRIRSAGLRYFAWVYSPSRFAQVSAEVPVTTLPPGTAKVFQSVEEAANWLRIQRRRDVARTQRIKLPLNLPKR